MSKYLPTRSSRTSEVYWSGQYYTNKTFKFVNFVYLGFYVAFNTVQVISRRVVGRAEETSTYSSLGFCTVNCRPMASNYQLSHLRPCRESNPGLRGGSSSLLKKCANTNTYNRHYAKLVQKIAYFTPLDLLMYNLLQSLRLKFNTSVLCRFVIKMNSFSKL